MSDNRCHGQIWALGGGAATSVSSGIRHCWLVKLEAGIRSRRSVVPCLLHCVLVLTSTGGFLSPTLGVILSPRMDAWGAFCPLLGDIIPLCFFLLWAVSSRAKRKA